MIEIPNTCPSCTHELELVNDQLYCRNKACNAQTMKKLEHFAKTLKIKGMGTKTLEKLNFEIPLDIYTFSVSHYVNILGEKVGRKLHNEVTASKNTSFATALSSFSIPLIGDTASQKLASVVNSFNLINEETCKKAGLGEKATYNLLLWLELQEYKDLPFIFNNKTIISNNLKVCITGKLNDFPNRDSAAKYLESLGFSCTDSVTKSTNVLVDEEERPSSKRLKAEELGIPILTIKELIERHYKTL